MTYDVRINLRSIQPKNLTPYKFVANLAEKLELNLFKVLRTIYDIDSTKIMAPKPHNSQGLHVGWQR